MGTHQIGDDVTAPLDLATFANAIRHEYAIACSRQALTPQPTVTRVVLERRTPVDWRALQEARLEAAIERIATRIGEHQVGPGPPREGFAIDTGDRDAVVARTDDVFEGAERARCRRASTRIGKRRSESNCRSQAMQLIVAQCRLCGLPKVRATAAISPMISASGHAVAVIGIADITGLSGSYCSNQRRQSRYVIAQRRHLGERPPACDKCV